MSRTSIYISIPTPCTVGWENMDTTEHGAYCHSCQTEVIDYSAMTDREVIEYLQRHKLGCGRFREDQLNTTLTLPRVSTATKWRAIFLSLLSTMSIRHMLAQGSNVSATKNNITIVESHNSQYADTVVLPQVDITASYAKHRMVQGVSTGISYQVKQSETPKPLSESISAKHRHKGLEWFRRVFRIKRKSNEAQ